MPVLVVTAQVITPDLGARVATLGAAVVSKTQVFGGDLELLRRAVTALLGPDGAAVAP